MSPLNRKMLRDLWHLKGQAVAIALVMACGIATFVLSRSLVHSLQLTQDSYYSRYNFAEVFASLKRAPESLKDRLAEIPGVGKVQTRIVQSVNLSVPGLEEPASGKLISLPENRPPLLNQLYFRRGRKLAPGRDDEVIASEAFTLANDLHVGDSIFAVINGRQKELRIVGIALSPEYVYEIKPGDLMPDNRHFGVFWMNHEALAMAYDSEGAFNDLTLSLMRGASAPEVLQRVDDLIEPYGGLGSYERKDQLSHQFLDNEIEQNRNMGMFAPTIFLGVAAFLLNVVMTRMINTQREEIAALKAFGYSKFEVGWHYLKSVLLIVSGALAVGMPLGIWFGSAVTEMYALFFHFPEFTFRIHASVLLAAGSVAVTAAVVGTVGSVLRAVRLPPAEAMRPEPPTGYGPTLLERFGLGRWVPPVALMVLRQLERHPVKTSLSVLAIALAVSVLVLGNFFQDSVNYMMAAQFHQVQRYDMSVGTTEAVADRAIYELASLPGVLQCEPNRSVPVRMRAGPRNRRVGIMGIRPDSQLFGLVNMDGRTVPLPSGGLLISRKLAEILDVSVGDWVQLEVLEGKKPIRQTMIAGTLQDFAGLSAYMNLEALRQLMREGPVVTGAHLLVDPKHETELYHELKSTPQLAAVTIKRHAIESFNETVAQNLGTMKTINLLFACVIAVGVVYNSARIPLSERSRELATMRVIGFTRQEISAVLLGELAVVTLAAIPLGLACGYFFAWWMTAAFNLEIFRFPLVITRFTYSFAALVVIVASMASGLIVRRRLDQLDLVAVLKSRE
ncbi:MAG: ABC transporter permease [Pirellulales bacterium]|nr:ABC transporter permease [Pirellulales bacterium]